MEKEKGNFEFVKEPKDKKRNYIFQKDSITKKTSLFVFVILLLLIAAVALTGILLSHN